MMKPVMDDKGGCFGSDTGVLPDGQKMVNVGFSKMINTGELSEPPAPFSFLEIAEKIKNNSCRGLLDTTFNNGKPKKVETPKPIKLSIDGEREMLEKSVGTELTDIIDLETNTQLEDKKKLSNYDPKKVDTLVLFRPRIPITPVPETTKDVQLTLITQPTREGIGYEHVVQSCN